jgi:hypothetical protein
MRKTLLTLMAAAALAAGAQPAAADVPSPYVENYTEEWAAGSYCYTDYQGGQLGAYGAQGYFIDGCTTSVQCPAAWAGCTVFDASVIWLKENNNRQASLNSRLRFDGGWKDSSCAATNGCGIDPDFKNAKLQLKPTQVVSVQCNGVREDVIDSEQTSAAVKCHVSLKRI